VRAWAGSLRAVWDAKRAEWLVILVAIVALAAGWGVRNYAENQVRPYWLTDRGAGAEQALYLSAPARWLSSRPADGVLRLRDVRAGGLAPTLEARVITIGGVQPFEQLLALEADALSLSRAQELTAYRILEMDDAVTLNGQPALRVSYVYVHDQPHAFEQHLPVVVLGEDLLTYQQGYLVVLSVQAAQGEFDRARRHYEGFLGSAAFRPLLSAGARHLSLRRAFM
jgi:hypothetical protein